ncbi:MAG: HAD family hydrolase [Candidatus Magasanikbacteria bacterium]|jgi:hypothetical protein
MFIIDFDDTLFDTYRFKQARLEAVKKFGVDENLYKETYARARLDQDGNYIYDDRRHAQILAASGFDEEVIFSAFAGVSARLKDFMLPGALDFLQSIRNLKQPMILLSLGDPKFQEAKVKGVDISQYFDRLFMVPDTKEKVLCELLQICDHDCWLINDKIDETQKLLSAFPQLQVVLRQSNEFSESDYARSGLKYFSDLVSVKNYVISQFK